MYNILYAHVKKVVFRLATRLSFTCMVWKKRYIPSWTSIQSWKRSYTIGWNHWIRFSEVFMHVFIQVTIFFLGGGLCWTVLNNRDCVFCGFCYCWYSMCTGVWKESSLNSLIKMQSRLWFFGDQSYWRFCPVLFILYQLRMGDVDLPLYDCPLSKVCVA